MTTLEPYRTDVDADALPPIELLLTARQITTPAKARALAVSAGLLADTFVDRMRRPDAGSHDGEWQFIVRDLQAALNEHARNLEERIGRHVEAFRVELEAGDTDG